MLLIIWFLIFFCKYFLSYSYNLIYLTYGNAHFKGVFDNLKAIDPNWKIVSTTQKVVFGGS